MLRDAYPQHRDLSASAGRCAAVSRQGNQCQLPNGHGQGCHEAMVDGDSRRWWGSAEEDQVTSVLTTRYPAGPGGVRIDRPDDTDNTGPALDMVSDNRLWTRGEDGQQVELQLSIENIWELREHFNYLLREAVHEREVTVNVPA